MVSLELTLGDRKVVPPELTMGYREIGPLELTQGHREVIPSMCPGSHSQGRSFRLRVPERTGWESSENFMKVT